MSDPTREQDLAASPIASLRGHHFAIRVPDYEAAKRWYVEKLDFRVIQEWPFGEMRLGYVAPRLDDSFYIELIGDGEVNEAARCNDVASSMYRAGFHHFCMTVNDVDQAIAYLEAQGVTIMGAPFDLEAIHRRLAFFTDPWGNFIELAQVID